MSNAWDPRGCRLEKHHCSTATAWWRNAGRRKTASRIKPAADGQPLSFFMSVVQARCGHDPAQLLAG